MHKNEGLGEKEWNERLGREAEEKRAKKAEEKP